MHSQEIRRALGKLQIEPDAEQAWSTLTSEIKTNDGDLSHEELVRLLDAAREEHARRGEWHAVARLLEVLVKVAEGSPREADLVAKQARVQAEELYDDEAAAICYLRLLELRPGEAGATSAIQESEGRRGRYQELVKSYLAEAEEASDDVYKSSMLMRASEMEVRYGGSGINLEQAIDRVEQAVRLDATNARASRLLEHLYRRAGRWEELARVLERLADRSEQPRERVAAGTRLARVYSQHLDDKERAAGAYDRVLRDEPGNAEATSFLSDFYASENRWAELVGLYERELKSNDQHESDRLGDMLQIAMLYWKKLERPQDAEPWFERVRKVEPTNEGTLSFYREYCAALGDDARLMDVLQGAQRALRDGTKEKANITQEIAKLAEGQANAQKAIEQYKSVLRQDPDHAEARERLKALYKQTQGYNALVELLRVQLERTPLDDYQTRLGILREVATVYRQYQKSDAALLSVLSQIVQLDDKIDVHDLEELREIVQLYERLGRHRDLITHQLKLAEVTPDVEEKRELYRSAGRRWLEQFSNAQNATEAYEKLLKVAPGDAEARRRLDELYRKRRSWNQLYELYSSELAEASGGERLTLMREMAQLAQERLNRPGDAIALYRQILEVDPDRVEILDALEKHAERSKDWATLADALERRAAIATDEQAKLATLQKLGSVYSEHLSNPEASVRTWRRVLELSPAHSRALRVLREAYLAGSNYDGLEQLYAAQNDWEGLAEVLSSAADRAKEAPARIELSYRAARVLEQQLNQPDRAFRSYERILLADPTDVRAARSLIPLYEKDEKWSRLPALYELLLDKAEGSEEKLALYARLVEVTGKRLGDRRAAAVYARRAYELVPDSAAALVLFEDASRAAGAWEAFVEALSLRLPADSVSRSETPPPPEAERSSGRRGKKRRKVESSQPSTPGLGLEPPRDQERRALELKLARVYSDELGRIDDAVAIYKRLLERDPADAEVTAVLETILRSGDRRDDLRWFFELRIENAAEADVRRRLLSEFAALEEEAFEAPDRAIGLYRRMLELDPSDKTALTTLARLLLAAGDAAGAAEVIAQHRDQLSGEARAELEAELSELYLERLNRPEDALKSAIAALDSPERAPRAVAVLESLVRIDTVRERAAAVLAERYAQSGDVRKEVQALEVMLTDARDPAHRRILIQRLTDAHETKLASHGNALDVLLRAVREFPSDIELWERADTLAVRAGRPTDLAEAFREVLREKLTRELEIDLAERAAHLFEDKLGDPIGATPYLERVLGLEPSNEAAFRRLKDILTAAERWGELEALYDRAAEATTDTTRRVEMLVEVALICEEIIEDAAKATRYYERITAIDPLHESANRALDRLYVLQGKDRELAQLLDRRLETAEGDDAIELKLRLAKLKLDLHEPEKAVSHVEDVLSVRVGDYEARALAERMLEIGELRQRAASMLENVYEVRDEIRDLVRVLEIRLEGLAEAKTQTVADERRELLRRIAHLRDDRLHDDESSFDAFARLVPLEPGDTEARRRLMEIGRRLGAHERVARVLGQAAKETEDPVLRGEILMHVAATYDELVGNRAEAERVYREVLELDRTNADLTLPAARALERIYMGANDNGKLAEILRIEVELELETATRQRILGRLGDLCERELLDNEGAISAWKQRLEEAGDDEAALSALDRLYEKAERYRDLVEVMRRRAELGSEPGLRRKLLERIAEAYWKRLDSTPDAIEAYRTLIGEYGPDGESLRVLEILFQSSERWEDLSDTLEQHIEIAGSDAERLELLAKLGDIKRERLLDVPSALAVYRRALALDSHHAASRSALDKLLDSKDAPARREAAQVLRPILEAEGAFEQLLRVLEIEIETSEDPPEKLSSLELALNVAERSLRDPARAFGYAERAVRAGVGHTDLVPWFEHLDRLAEATSRQREHVALLCDVVPNIFDGEVQLAVTLKIADLARHKLQDRDLAREYYKKALETRADERRALAALEALYEESGDAKNLLEVLERRADIAETDEDKKQLMFRRARLLSDVLDDKAQAIDVYQIILDLALERAAVDALETLYTGAGRWTDLIALYQRQLDAKLGAPADLHVSIGRVASRNQGNIALAFDELEEALKRDRQHPGAIGELERLLLEAPELEQRAHAAALLEPVYLARADYTRVMDTIRARLEYAPSPEERRELLTRLAKLYEEQKEDYRAALETIARLLHEDVSDQSTVHELERLAKVAGAEDRLAEIYAAELGTIDADDATSAKLARRTGELFDTLAKPDRALEFYRRALAFSAESRPLFDSIDAILKRLSRHEERVKLYRDALEYRFDPADRLATLHTIAALERRELGRADAAIETYRAALEVDDVDARTLDALGELYTERERWDDLAELYLRRAEAAREPSVAAEYRLSLARLHARTGEVERAVDQLEEIVRVLPDHAQAVGELEALRKNEKLRERVVDILRPLYEAADDWRRQITLNEDRFALAGDPAGRVAVLRETSELWERRGGDLRRARRALEAAVRIDPDDGDVRREYERLTEQTGAWDQFTQVYEDVLAENPELASRREVLAVLAEVHDARRNDPRRSLDAYDRLRATDETDIAPLEKMEALATLLSDWPTLVRVLTAKADLLLDDGERASVWRRVGEAKRDMLEDADGAIQAYERALDLDADSAFTLDCLIELYEGKRDAPRLVELYQRRVELTSEDDADLKFTLLTLAATAYEKELSDRTRAIEALVQALAVRPGDEAVRDSLNRLYRAESMWPELLESLRGQAEAATDARARAALRREIGDILADKLSSMEDALEAYRLALEDAPDDTGIVGKVRALGEGHEDLRSQVAAVLVPVLKRTERWEQLADVLELRLSVETDPGDRTATLVAMAEVLETRLGRGGDAETALLRALAERPDAEELHREVTRLAAGSGGWARYADVLTERAQATFEPEVVRDLYVRLAKVAEEKLGDDRRAVEGYVKAIEQSGDQAESLDALDRLYTRLRDHAALADVLERRVLVEPVESRQAELFYRLAVLQNEEFKESARALGSLRTALERAPEHESAVAELEKLTREPELFEEAAEVLEGVYRTRKQTNRLAALYEKRVIHADSPGAKVDMQKALARVLEDDAHDTRAAQRVIEQSVLEAPGDMSLIDELERLANQTGEWTLAGEALEKAIEQNTELESEAAVELCVRLSGWLRDKASDPAGAERVLVRALRYDPENDDVLAKLEELQKGSGRERDLFETVRRRAKLQIDDRRREELYAQAKEIADGLGDTKAAESVLRELLSLDDMNAWALDSLSVMRELAGDYKETFELLVRQSELSTDEENTRELKRKAAGIARDKLEQKTRAIELFEQLFEDDSSDTAAAGALRDLYAEQGRYQDLGRLIERLIDVATSAAERSALRLELSRLTEERFVSLDSAIDQLRAVLDEEPGHDLAVMRLSELYERTQRDEELAQLLTSQIEDANARNDTEAELRFQTRLGDIYESRLRDRPRAIDIYRSVLDRNPEHVGALEALARLLAADGRLEEATDVMERLLKLANGDEAVRRSLELASVYEKQSMVERATRALEMGLKADRRNAEIRKRLRPLYLSQADWQALAELHSEEAEFAEKPEEAVQLLRQSAAIHADKRDDLFRASELLERATQLKPGDRELLLELCDLYGKSGRGREAVRVLERVVESFGQKRTRELGEIHRRLANAYLADGEVQRALDELDKAFRIEPGNLQVLTLLGDVAIRAKDYKKAQQMYRALLLQKLDAGAPVSKSQVFLRLGDIHEAVGETPKAIQMYERAVQTDGSPEAKEKLANLKK
jgi:tetratricopeptide (TPR) repeat protein